MICMSTLSFACAIVVALWIGAAAGVMSLALCGASACTHDCDQGDSCTCRRTM